MQNTLQVFLPYSKGLITQKFGDNANPLYKDQGLKGHTAFDWGALYGTKIPNCTFDAYCYSIMHQNDPVLMDYRAAFFIVETQTGTYEVSYGHMSTILALPGKTYQPGDLIGLVGNTGPVFVGQHEVTEAEKDAGSHAGAHLHGPQIRPVVKTQYSNKYSNYLVGANGNKYVDTNGFFYGILSYDNGYNGCVSPEPFFTNTLASEYHPTPIDLGKVSEIVGNTAQAVQLIQALPPDQQKRWFDPLIQILSSLAKLLR